MLFPRFLNPSRTVDGYSRSLRDATGPVDLYSRIPTSTQVTCIAAQRTAAQRTAAQRTAHSRTQCIRVPCTCTHALCINIA